MGNIEIFKLFGSIFVDSDEANKSISKTGKEADGLGKKLSNGIKTAGKWALGIGAAAVGVGTAMFAMTKKVTGDFDRIAKDSKKLGVTTDAFQEMEYWASQNGLSSNDMERAVGRLNQRIGLAADGNDKYADALERLGVNMDDVRAGTVTTEEAMYQSISALSQMTNEQEKSAMASELFGTKLARELMPALQDGSLSLEDAAKKAQELGIVIDEDTLSSAEKFNDTWDDLTRMMGAFGQKVLAELMPVFQRMMDWVVDNMPAIQRVFQAVFDVIGTVFSTFTGWIGGLISWLSTWFSSNQETMNGIWETIQNVFSSIVEFLQNAWEMIRAFWEEHGEAILENVMTVFGRIWEVVQTAFNIVVEVIQQALEWIVPFVKEMLDKVFAFWEENGEAIMEALNNVFDFIIDAWNWLYEAIMPIVEYLWNQISTIFETTLDVILGLVDFFVGLFTGDWERMKDAVIGIVGDLWDGVTGLFENAWNFVKEPLDKLWENISGWFTGLKDSAFEWGANMISGFVDGIKSIPGKVKDAAKGVIDNVAGFLKFWSPAEEGEGRHIVEWGANMVDGFLDGVKDETDEAGKVMNDLIGSMNPANFRAITSPMTKTEQPESNKLEDLFIQLIEAVKERQVMQVDDRIFAEIVGDYSDNEGGKRIRLVERGLAT